MSKRIGRRGSASLAIGGIENGEGSLVIVSRTTRSGWSGRRDGRRRVGGSLIGPGIGMTGTLLECDGCEVGS